MERAGLSSPDQEAVASFMFSQHCRGMAAFLNVTVHVLESNMATQSQVRLRRELSDCVYWTGF